MSFLFWMQCRCCHAWNKIEAKKRYVLNEAEEIFIPYIFPDEDQNCYTRRKDFGEEEPAD